VPALPPIDLLALALTGFSLFAALLLLLAQFTVYREVELGPIPRAAGVLLLAGLALLQIEHARYLLGAGALSPSIYPALLFLAASAFHLFFRGALMPRERVGPGSLWLLLPVAIAPWLPSAAAIPLAFVLGSVYALGLMRLAWRLRGQRRRFRLEAAAFAAHGAVALLILVLGLMAPWLGLRWYVLGYASLIGIGLLAALYTLLRIPDLAVNTIEAVRSAYANSTLKSVDVDAVLARLDRLMTVERVYMQESLSLGSLAEALELGPHQLSELINSRFGIGFPRYVREQRVRAAQRMLLEEPRASVLSVGLSVGFTSQSNFYAAFREITGEVPGRFRRRGREAGED
jgi:AraC-like DNA-binding protein